MKKINLIFILMLLLSSCTKEEVNSQKGAVSGMQIFNAQMSDAAVTKTHLNGELKQLWDQDDEISIFTPSINNAKYNYTGTGNSASGTFVCNDQIESQSTGVSTNYAVYPYSKSNTISPSGEITVTFPTDQTYKTGSFDQSMNKMVAVTKNADDNNLAFKNICSYLTIKLYGNYTVKRIELRASGGEKIAGSATVKASYNSAPTVEMSSSGTSLITLYCGDGVELGTTSENATEFWFVLPAGISLSKGINICVTATDYSILKKSTSNKIVIKRNNIQPMAAIDLSTIQPSNEIWYTSTNGARIDLNSTDFGAGAIAQTNTYSNGKGVIKCNGQIAYIPNRLFAADDDGYHKLESVSIPEGVITLSSYAFYGCERLSEISLPNSLKRIEDYAFAECGGRAYVGSGRYLRVEVNVDIPENVTYIGASAFEKSGIVSITIPPKVTTINPSTFRQCSYLESATIPSSVVSITNLAFYNCESLNKVICYPATPPSLGTNVFTACNSSLGIYVPLPYYSTYITTTGWKDLNIKQL